jgi:hypothetical protein
MGTLEDEWKGALRTILLRRMLNFGFDLVYRTCGSGNLKHAEGGIQIIGNLEKLRESQKLEHIHYLVLQSEKNHVTLFLLEVLEKSSEGSNAGTADVVETVAVENDANDARVDELVYMGLELRRVVGVQIACQNQLNGLSITTHLHGRYLQRVFDVDLFHGPPLST